MAAVDTGEPKRLCVSGLRGKASRAVGAVRETAARTKEPLLNGALTRVGVVLALFPLDAMKTRAQIRTGRSMPSPGALLRASPLVLSQGALRLFRGAPAAAVAAAGAGALSYIVYATITRRPAQVATVGAPGLSTKTGMQPAHAWMAAEVAAGAWAVPFEGAKTRVQAGVSANAARALRDCMKGPFSMYSGGVAHLAREVPTRALMLLLAARISRAITRRRGVQSSPMVEAAATGAVAAVATAPLDLMRTRVMAQRLGASKLYYNFVACGVDVVRREGPLALFRGAPFRVAYIALSATMFASGFGFTERTLRERRWLWYSRGGDKLQDGEEK